MKNYRFILTMLCAAAVFLCAGQAAFAAAPVNDSASNALSIGNVSNQAFDTTNATNDGPDGYIYSANIWYCYTATHTGTTTVSLCGSSFDTKLVVYDGCQSPASTSRVVQGATGDGGSGKDDDSCGFSGGGSKVSFPSICGNQYLIEVGGYGYNKGQGVISISATGTPCSSAPANNNCSNAQVVSNVTGLAFSTANATHDGPGDCMLGRPNIWYKYTATCTGPLTVSICGDFDTLLAIYTGTYCGNLTQVPFACNDAPQSPDYCPSYAWQSKLTINVSAGTTYWIEVGGRGTGSGILNISCSGGQVQYPYDLGDAPDSTNHFAKDMRTYYTNLKAYFPTVYEGNPIHGPIHFMPKAKAYLGNSVTFESEADQGPDQDPTNNILPNTNEANKDLGDDGIPPDRLPLILDTCKLNSFKYDVYVVDPNQDMYVNVWFDWNRDGDWNDDGTTDQTLNCQTCNGTGNIKEWAVQNQLLFGLNPGKNTITTPGFLAWNPNTWIYTALWMRITISDQPFKGGSGAGGSGPAAGYMYGETEDYYFYPEQGCVVCEDLTGDGEVDLNDLIEYMLNWLDNCN